MITITALVSTACLTAIAWAARQVLVHQRVRDLRSAYLNACADVSERVHD